MIFLCWVKFVLYLDFTFSDVLRKLLQFPHSKWYLYLTVQFLIIFFLIVGSTQIAWNFWVIDLKYIWCFAFLNIYNYGFLVFLWKILTLKCCLTSSSATFNTQALLSLLQLKDKDIDQLFIFGSFLITGVAYHPKDPWFCPSKFHSMKSERN